MDEEEAPLFEHVADLRKALLRICAIIGIAFVVCFTYYDSILAYLQTPLQKPGLVLLGPLEGILVALKTTFWISVVSTSPLWLCVLMQFAFPGLRSKEKRLAIGFVLTSILLVTTGFFFAFFVTIPLANQYLFSFNEAVGVNLWSLERYLDYTLFLLLANGFAFELGAVGIFAVHLGYITSDMLIAKRRHAIVCAFVVAAVLTPPDILTQFLLAIPLMCLYEGLILYARAQERWWRTLKNS